MPRNFNPNAKSKKYSEPDHADWETTIECLNLMESGYYDQCFCGWNGDHDEDAEEFFWEQFEDEY